jgi:hypothetical protein
MVCCRLMPVFKPATPKDENPPSAGSWLLYENELFSSLPFRAQWYLYVLPTLTIKTSRCYHVVRLSIRINVSCFSEQPFPGFFVFERRCFL